MNKTIYETKYTFILDYHFFSFWLQMSEFSDTWKTGFRPLGLILSTWKKQLFVLFSVASSIKVFKRIMVALDMEFNGVY